VTWGRRSAVPLQAEVAAAVWLETLRTTQHTHHHGQEEGFHDPREEEEVEDPAEEEGCRGAEEGAGEESGREAEGHLRALRHQEGHRERQRGRAQEDCQGVL